MGTPEEEGPEAPPGGGDARRESERIRCVCGSDEDDGFTIQCDACLAWQHARCMGIGRNAVPEVHYCAECRPGRAHAPAISGKTHERGRAPRRRQPAAGAAQAPAAVPGGGEDDAEVVAANAYSAAAEGAAGVLRALYGAARARMPRLHGATDADALSAADLGLAEVVALDAPVGCEPHAYIRAASRVVEARDLRPGRGGTHGVAGRRPGPGGPRQGVFACADVPPGVLLAEYVGDVATVAEVAASLGGAPAAVAQAHVLCVPAAVAAAGLVVDARRRGCVLRAARRSCRPNATPKLVLLRHVSPAGLSVSVHWCVFSRGTIRAGDEVLLPVDYGHGNRFLRYECACAQPEMCVADAPPPAASGRTAVRRESAEDAAPPHARRPSVRRAPSSESAGAAADARVPPAAGRRRDAKLSREERKLQQYIEFIERMESSAERRQAAAKRTSGARASRPGTPPAADAIDSSTEMPSPIKAGGRASLSSSEASHAAPLAGGHGAAVGAKRHVDHGEEAVVKTEDAGHSEAESKADHRDRGTEELPDATHSPSGAGRDTGAVPPGSSPAALPPKKAFARAFAPAQPHGSSPRAPESPAASAHDDTPSKKRVSLSDYLRRKRSDADGLSSDLSHDAHP